MIFAVLNAMNISTEKILKDFMIKKLIIIKVK